MGEGNPWPYATVRESGTMSAVILAAARTLGMHTSRAFVPLVIILLVVYNVYVHVCIYLLIDRSIDRRTDRQLLCVDTVDGIKWVTSVVWDTPGMGLSGHVTRVLGWEIIRA